MAISITASVGEKGNNQNEDVKLVYSLFNKILKKMLTVTNQCPPELIKAIKDFQKPFMKQPNGRIDPNGPTWKKLAVAAGMVGKGITASVGEKGKNQNVDVKLVYSLFNKVLKKRLTVTNQCPPELIKAIKDFQKPFMQQPDGKIDPNGATWKKLVVAAGMLGKGVSLVLSFDDGPAPEKALRGILATLQASGIKAEFYVLGTEVDRHPAAAKKIVIGGHKIQNHSYSHPNLAKAKEEVVRSELQKTQESIKKATGATATKVRPPYGAGGWPPKYDPELAKVAGSLSLKIQNWDIDTKDWQAPKGVGQTKLTMIEDQFWGKQNKTTLNVLMHVQSETARDLATFITQLQTT